MCLNLCEQESISLLKKSYDELSSIFKLLNLDINREFRNKVPDSGGFMLLRELDCLVIRHVHDMVEEKGISFDTVCGYFQEGNDAYLGSGIREKSHIQVCVRNTDCIKGYFLPRK